MKNKKFVFSMWTYNDLCEFTPDEMDTWADLGINLPMLPKTYVDRDDPKLLLPWLDKAKELGVEAIVNYEDMSYRAYVELGAEGYEARIKPLYDALASHPAVHGFCIGDEPGTKENMAASLEAIRINKKLAPHLTPYLNYRGDTLSMDEQLGGLDFNGWMKRVYDETGSDEICFDDYTQQINDTGKAWYLGAVRKWADAGRAAGDSDVWACLLSSGHHVYAPPTEVDYRWQINTAAALGMRGVLWFRLYDRENVISYYGSPIDEFGDKSEAYYALKRCQRRFSNHFGEIFMKLRLKENYLVGSDWGVFPTFGPGCHEAIKDIKANDGTLVSFFEDAEGREYLVIVDLETRFYGDVYVYLDKSRYSLVELTMNGAVETRPDGPQADCESGESFVEFTPIPAALHLFRIDKK